MSGEIWTCAAYYIKRWMRPISVATVSLRTILALPASSLQKQLEGDRIGFRHQSAVKNCIGEISDVACAKKIYLSYLLALALLSTGAAAQDETSAAFVEQKLREWNGDFLWAPASKRELGQQSGFDINVAGDEARAVFGPIPRLSCGGEPDGREVIVYSTEINGNKVIAIDQDQSGLVFRQQSPTGEIVGPDMTRIDECDKPSLAGGTSFCGLNSRLAVKIQGNGVQWVMLCRKSKVPDTTISNDLFWSATNSKFSLLGIIGFNQETGEVTFFDGKEAREFDWSEPIPPPGGGGYGDIDGRAEARSKYDSTFGIDCHNCHDNKDPWIRTPHLTLEGIGYRDPIRRHAFSIGNVLPKRFPAGDRDAPYRIVGTGYTETYGKKENDKYGLGTYPNGFTIADPTGTCTECHTLTNLNTGRVFAHDAVGKKNPGYTHDKPFPSTYWQRLEQVRTDWSKRTGDGKIFPWMLPKKGANLSGDPPPAVMDDDAWKELAACLNLTVPEGGEDEEFLRLKEKCDAKPLWTACPAPGAPKTPATQLSDPNDVQQLELLSRDRSDGDANADFPMEVTIEWKYWNNFGGVARRDDVRFDMAVLGANIPADSGSSSPDEFPPMEPLSASGSGMQIEVPSEDEFFLRNISYFGHTKFTDPEMPSPPGTLRQYKVRFPAQCGRRYLVRVVAKRFCFQHEPKLAFGSRDHLSSVDVVCGQ